VRLLIGHGHSRRYVLPMPADCKGARGGDVMSRTHATASACSYGMRYLATMTFNLAIDRDDDGNAAAAPSRSRLIGPERMRLSAGRAQDQGELQYKGCCSPQWRLP
jgi:hypothetical protein